MNSRSWLFLQSHVVFSLSGTCLSGRYQFLRLLTLHNRPANAKIASNGVRVELGVLFVAGRVVPFGDGMVIGRVVLTGTGVVIADGVRVVRTGISV